MSGKSTGKRRGRPAKKGRLCLKRRQQLERELRKKQKEEAAAEAALAAAAAEEAADAGPAAGAAAPAAGAAAAATRATRAAAAAETAVAAAAVAAASAPSERHAASGRLGKAAQINGSVKHVNLSPDDLAATARLAVHGRPRGLRSPHARGRPRRRRRTRIR